MFVSQKLSVDQAQIKFHKFPQQYLNMEFFKLTIKNFAGKMEKPVENAI